MHYLQKIFNSIFKRDENIAPPPYRYEFLIDLDEKYYPLYLRKIFKEKTGDELNLKNPKTFNEKIQWLKLYDTTALKTQLTDKVLVRDWISNKIGKEYLKPILQVCNSFDEIDFESLPSSFFIKTNHGCKWQYKIKDKKAFLSEEKLFNKIKNQFDDWMRRTFFPYAGFEMQYKEIMPKILIEPILAETANDFPLEYEIYCFNGVPKIYQKIRYSLHPEACVYNENYAKSDVVFNNSYIEYFEDADDMLKKAVELSKQLAKDFKLVRVDWLVHQDHLYFNELTFTPFAGFFQFENKKTDLVLGNMLKIK